MPTKASIERFAQRQTSKRRKGSKAKVSLDSRGQSLNIKTCREAVSLTLPALPAPTELIKRVINVVARMKRKELERKNERTRSKAYFKNVGN